MNDRLNEYVDGVFAPYEGTKSVSELKADLLADLQERFRELRAEGKDEATAFEMTVDSIGDIEETVQEVSNLSRVLERQVVTRFDASDLQGSDFAGVTARQRKVRGERAARLQLLARRSHRQQVQEQRCGGRQLRRRQSDRCELHDGRPGAGQLPQGAPGAHRLQHVRARPGPGSPTPRSPTSSSA